MIISHRHGFIFLKTRKTAGTSLEIALSEFCGPDDLITRIVPEDEEIRRARGYCGPQNDYFGSVRVANHDPATLARAIVGPVNWDRYFKFTIERNPYDQVISRYWWATRRMAPRPSIGEYLAAVPKGKLSNWSIYTIDDVVAVDRVLRYEDLTDELATLGQRLGIGTLRMANAKAGYRKDQRHYREVLGPAERRLVEEECWRELSLLNYAW